MDRITTALIEEILGKFDMVKIKRNRVEFFGDADDFTADELHNFDSEPDGIGNVWLVKEYKQNGTEFSLNIREKKPFRKEGEFNTER